MAATNGMKKSVKLFYDVVSPYSWLGFELLCRYKQKWNIDLIFKPFYIAGVIKESGNTMPWTVPNKGTYILNDLTRLSTFYKIPLNVPKDLMSVIMSKGSLRAQRLLTAVQAKHPDKVEEISREFFLRVWSRNEDIYDDDSLKAVLSKVAFEGQHIDGLLESSRTKEIADKLKLTTKEAMDAKAFGSPIIIFNDQKGKEHMLFGSDRMELLAFLIGEKYEGPLAHLSKL